MTRMNPGAVFAAAVIAVFVFAASSRAETVAGKADFERALQLHAGDPSGKAAGKALPSYKVSVHGFPQGREGSGIDRLGGVLI